MKRGAQSRTKARWAIGLFSVAMLIAFYNLIPFQNPGPAMSGTRENKAATKDEALKDIDGLPLQANLFERRQFVSFESGRNIFRIKEEEKHSPVASFEDHKIATPDFDKPKANVEMAPIDLKFFGYFRKSGEPKKILVSQGETIFLAQEGSLVGLRYKILEIRNNSVVVQDVLSDQQQSLSLAQ